MMSGIWRMFAPAAMVLAGCAVLAAWHWSRTVDGRPAPDDATATLPAPTAPVPAETASGTDPQAMSPQPLRISAPREDIRMLILSFASGASAPAEQIALEHDARTGGGLVPPQVWDMPQPLYMPAEDAVDAQRRISDASQRAVRADDPRERAAALQELAAIGDVGVLVTLDEALFDPDPRVQRAAVAAAQSLALYRGDEDGDVMRWLISAAGAGDAGVAEQARVGANEVALRRGEDPPFL